MSTALPDSTAEAVARHLMRTPATAYLDRCVLLMAAEPVDDTIHLGVYAPSDTGELCQSIAAVLKVMQARTWWIQNVRATDEMVVLETPHMNRADMDITVQQLLDLVRPFARALDCTGNLPVYALRSGQRIVPVISRYHLASPESHLLEVGFPKVLRFTCEEENGGNELDLYFGAVVSQHARVLGVSMEHGDDTRSVIATINVDDWWEMPGQGMIDWLLADLVTGLGRQALPYEGDRLVFCLANSIKMDEVRNRA